MVNLTQLYDKHIDNLFMFGTKFTADRELIKDCIQDVFVKLFNKRAQLDKVNNIESYLYVSLRNRINDEFRRQTHLCDDEITDANMKPLCDSGGGIQHGAHGGGEPHAHHDAIHQQPLAQAAADHTPLLYRGAQIRRYLPDYGHQLPVCA